MHVVNGVLRLAQGRLSATEPVEAPNAPGPDLFCTICNHVSICFKAIGGYLGQQPYYAATGMVSLFRLFGRPGPAVSYSSPLCLSVFLFGF